MNTAMKPPRILIVDDEPANVHALAAALNGLYELHFAIHGARAIELLQNHAFDLILLDVVMPQVDGFAVLNAVRNHPEHQHTPVIFVTSMGETDDEARGLELGAVDYITKPANPHIVRARVATHLEIKRQRDLLERFAYLDGLTGIPNRRKFEHEWRQQFATAHRQVRPLGILLIDIDYFKTYNDFYGHMQGDDCLRQVAEVLQTCSKGRGFAARYGGEEFVVLCEALDTAPLAQAILNTIRDRKLPHEGSKFERLLSVSIGGLVFVPQAANESDSRFAEVDALLYQAKRDGRNRCCLRDNSTLQILLGGSP